MLDGLSVGKQGMLLVYANDATRDGAPRDLTFMSTDSGRSWKDLNEGSAQGGYFDSDTNIQYALFAYTLRGYMAYRPHLAGLEMVASADIGYVQTYVPE